MSGEEENEVNRLKRYQDIILEISGMIRVDEEEEEEHNDVCIYKTLRYPPKSTPPTMD